MDNHCIFYISFHPRIFFFIHKNSIWNTTLLQDKSIISPLTFRNLLKRKNTLTFWTDDRHPQILTTHTHTIISKSASKYPTFHGCIDLSEIWTLHQICVKHIQMCMQSITLHSRCGKTCAHTHKWVIRIYICWIEENKLAVSQDLMIFWHQLTDIECWICHQLRG